MFAPALSIVVPCYNEAGNIPLIFDRFTQVLDNRSDVEVLLVNNGSRDSSAQVFEQQLAQRNDRRFRVVLVEVNQGYGFGILSGLAEARGEVLAWTHADMQTDPNDVLIAWEKYLAAGNVNVLVKGKRKNRAALEAFFTWGMQILSSWALGVHLDDVNAQPKLFSRSFYERFLRSGAPHDFSLDLYALYCAQKTGTILTVPVIFAKRLHGEAKGGGNWKTRIKLIKRTWAYIFQLSAEIKAKGLPA